MAQNPAKRLCPSYGPENVTCLGQTDIEKDGFSFLWTVGNFSTLRNLESLQSPIFVGGPKTKHRWGLVLFPKKRVANVDSVCMFLWHVDYETVELAIKTVFQFSILDGDGRPAFQTAKLPHSFTRYSDSTAVCKLISLADLMVQDKELVVNDSFKILCQIWIEGELKQNLGSPIGTISVEERSRLCKDRLAYDLQNMYKQSIGTDVTILAGNSILKAHKAILTARSSVFAAMLNNVGNMLEMETATVTITDFDEEIVKGMLDHLYTGQADCMEERAPELLQIAEKYDLYELKNHCESAIAQSLNNDNVVVILTLADKHNASYLKSRAVDFIKINKRELSQMESFQAAIKSPSASGVIAELFLLLS